VEINFKDKSLRDLCNHESLAQRNLGTNMARKLKLRLTQLSAALSMSELLVGRPHPLTEKRAGQFALDLVHPRRLVFEPDHDPIPQTEDGGIDWSQVTRVIIVYIGDYHA
jgi:Plasmid maintenance system killer protein.